MSLEVQEGKEIAINLRLLVLRTDCTCPLSIQDLGKQLSEELCHVFVELVASCPYRVQLPVPPYFSLKIQLSIGRGLRLFIILVNMFFSLRAHPKRGGA